MRLLDTVRAIICVAPAITFAGLGFGHAPAKSVIITSTSQTTGMKFVLIKAGTFRMGSPNGEKDRDEEELEHPVTITKEFFLGMHPVTRGQFRQFVFATGHQTTAETDTTGGTGWNLAKKDWNERGPEYTWRNTGFLQTEEHPVVNVSWNDAVTFARWLSRKDGREYRLPTEAEWEFACRAGTKTRFSFGDDDNVLAKFGNAADQDFRVATGESWGSPFFDGHAFTAPVGSFPPNPWGLYDMHGNVFQWCEDFDDKYPAGHAIDPHGPSEGSRRVVRGGSWLNLARFCRSAYRFRFFPEDRTCITGFRLALVKPNP
jgi:formylglycine-generating enzyme required for sulfatase activity